MDFPLGLVLKLGLLRSTSANKDVQLELGARFAEKILNKK